MDDVTSLACNLVKARSELFLNNTPDLSKEFQ